MIGNPIALPLAFISHYLMDAIPHFGWPSEETKTLKSRIFKNYLIIEAIVCFLIVLTLFVTQPANWFLASVCAFFAAMPDMFSYARFKNIRNGRSYSRGA